MPLIEADLSAVLALDQRTLGGLWTRSGYQRELDSPLSDLRVLVSAPTRTLLDRRRQLPVETADDTLAAVDPTASASSSDSSLRLLGSGCLWAILEEAHITTLAIEPSYQGQKLGLLLLSDLLTCAQTRGLTRATLEVRASNQKALNLYQKFDFKEAGQRKRYYSDGENARILWRNHLQDDACHAQITQNREQAIAAIGAHCQHTVLPDLIENKFIEGDLPENSPAKTT